MEDFIGWAGAFISVPAFGIQTYREWRHRDRPLPLLSLWSFIFALMGSTGLLLYGAMIHNRVLLFLNAALIVNNAVGLTIALHRLNRGPKAETVSRGAA